MSIFEYVSYGEFIRLIVCLSIDLVEYVVPFLLTPFAGDLYDIVGLAASFYMFGWIGLFSGLDLVPGLDILPINTITWLIWVVVRHWKEIQDAMGTFGTFGDES